MAEEDRTVVLDISSDDDLGWGGGGLTVSGGDGGSVGCRDDGDWISELLGEVDKGKDDDSDDVVVLGEVIVKPNLSVDKSLLKCVNKVRDDKEEEEEDFDDDECVVLDEDPDKPITIQEDNEGEDSDDLLVVSEKGPVACRDYPHARHLCVKFPFNSTAHESHCDQCHCYVCDSLAPCLHWSVGITTIDHCHANDKDEFWKNQRKNAKQSNDTLAVVSRATEISTSVGQSPSRQISSSLPSGCVQRYITPESSIAPVSQPVDSPRDKFPPKLVSHPLQYAQRNLIRGDRRHIGVNAGSQVISRTPFRSSSMTSGALTANQYCNNAYRFTYTRRNSHPRMLGPRWVDPRSGVTTAHNPRKDSSRTNVDGTATNLMPNMLSRTNLGSANYTSFQLQMLSQAHGGSGNKYAHVRQQQLSSLMNLGSNFNSPMVAQAAIGVRPNWGQTFDNPFPFQSQETFSLERAKVSQTSGPFLSRSATFPSNVADIYNRSFPSQPNAGNAFENSSAYHSQVCSSATSPLTARNYVLVQGIHSRSAMQSTSTDVHQAEGCSLDASGENLTVQTNTVQSVMHLNSTEIDSGLDFQGSCKNQLLAVDQLQNAVQSDKGNVPLDGNSESPVCPDFYSLDLQFDPWIFENESGLDAVGNSLVCPEATVLGGGLFDF